MADIDSATAEIRRGIEKEEEETGQNEEIKKEERRKKQDENIYGLPYYIGRP